MRKARSKTESPLDGTIRPNFWLEVYWLTVLGLCAWIVALAILTPAFVRLRESLAFEADCRQRVEAVSARNTDLKKALNAFETDPYYREEVIRAILGVKRYDEVFLR